MIQVHDLRVAYAGQVVLQDVSFEVPAGECLVVTGPSGCGKSTLARVLTGLIPQVIPAEISGTVRVAGMDVVAQTPAQISTCVGTVFQDPSTHLFHLRVADEVAFGPRNLGLPGEEIQRRVAWAMDALGLNDLAARKPSDLSGGQKQRLAIASALAMRPQVLVLDEPTASLDVPGTRSVVSSLDELRRTHGLTLVLMEHRLAEVRNLADKVLVLDHGRSVAAGEFIAILGDHDLQQRYGLRRPTEEPLTSWEDLLSPNGKAPPDVQPLLRVENVSAGYRGSAVVERVNLDIYPREFVALVGDNGAGKSTLALAIAGLLKPLQGKIYFQGRAKPRPGQDISLLFQNPADQLFTDSVREEIVFGPRNLRCQDAAWEARVLESADLADLQARKPLSLSVGQQQRTALASCLALRPRLVILDEPTLGQDWGHLQQLMNFIQSLNLEGTAILLITHDYKLVYRYAQRVVLMDHGRIALDGHNKGATQRVFSGAAHTQAEHAAS